MAASTTTPPTTPRLVGDWALEQEIGAGSFAVVWRARHASSGAPAAVKEINTEKLNRKLQESLASEVAVLDQASHANIVRLLDHLTVCGLCVVCVRVRAGGARTWW